MRSDRRDRRSALGLGPLETAIMQVMWDVGVWLTVRDFRGRVNYAPVAYTTVAKVTGTLYDKGLLVRQPGDREGKPGPPAWRYYAARPINEHIRELIVALLDHSPDPETTLGYALAARRLPSKARTLHRGPWLHRPRASYSPVRQAIDVPYVARTPLAPLSGLQSKSGTEISQNNLRYVPVGQPVSPQRAPCGDEEHGPLGGLAFYPLYRKQYLWALDDTAIGFQDTAMAHG